nr:hypothetical protein [Tanacetum cinerariifolium]
MTEHESYVFGESLSGQVNESEPGPSTSGNQEQLDDFDFWMDSYATDDDELSTEKVSQELVEEMSQIVDEVKLCKTRFVPRKKFNVLAQHLQEIMEELLPTMNSAKRQKTSKHGTFVFGESSSGQDYKSEPGPSTSGNQEQLDDFDFWTDSYATDDDEIPTKKVSQELMNEMSQIVDEAKLRKVVDEMLRQ